MRREPAKAARDEFAEGHQVVFVVAVLGAPPTARPPSWCSRARSHPAARRPARRGRRAGSAKCARSACPVARRQLVQLERQQRHRGLRRHHEVGARRRAARGRPRPASRACARRRISRPASTLVCSSATESSPAGRLCSPGPAQAASATTAAAAAAGPQLAAAAAQQARQRRRREGQHRADAVDADPGRQCRQRRVDLRIARGQPRKPGEDHAAGQFGQQPQRREQQRVAGAAAAPAGVGRARPAPGRPTAPPPAAAPPAPPSTPAARRSGAC